VGAYTGSGGFYGTFDQGGNVFEWNDAVIGGTSRGLRGGSWVSGESGLRSSFRIFNDPTLESEDLGFRVAGALPPAAAARPAALPKVSTSGPPARVIKALKKQVKTLKAQLAAATAVPPTPAPFVEMVKVGNAGNAADPEDGDNNVGGTQNFGAVPYEYSIGKYEVTLAQYVAFLNAVAATDTHGLYNGSMATDLNSAGITQNGASPSFTYSVIGTGTRPVTLVNWFDAARFCNWLHNGRPKGAQDAGTTETGAYALNGANSGVVITREATAKFWLPNADEWHKAAYHQPASQGGDTDNYWLYPTGSNTIPTVATVNEIGEITNDNENIANYAFGAVWNGQNGNLTSVGSGGAGSASHYGAFDMGGNVEEWTDFAEATFRFVLGGTFISTESAMRASERNRLNPVTHFPDLGFRVAGSVN
jgi:formylglycine-generating enzyme required for sulfatase activity